jgi:hypothetical protein
LTLATSICLLASSFVGECAARMPSISGRCFASGAVANGCARGDGSEACRPTVADISSYVVVFGGSRVNQDGKSASTTASSGLL